MWPCRDMLVSFCTWSLPCFFSWLVATTLGSYNMLTVQPCHTWVLGFNTARHWLFVSTVPRQACYGETKSSDGWETQTVPFGALWVHKECGCCWNTVLVHCNKGRVALKFTSADKKLETLGGKVLASVTGVCGLPILWEPIVCCPLKRVTGSCCASCLHYRCGVQYLQGPRQVSFSPSIIISLLEVKENWQKFIHSMSKCSFCSFEQNTSELCTCGLGCTEHIIHIVVRFLPTDELCTLSPQTMWPVWAAGPSTTAQAATIHLLSFVAPCGNHIL